MCCRCREGGSPPNGCDVVEKEGLRSDDNDDVDNDSNYNRVN